MVAMIALLATALAARLALALLHPVAFGDEREYVEHAERIFAGDWRPFKNVMHFVRAPGYPLFIALIWELVGQASLTAVRVAQALVDTSTCWAIFLLARRAGADRWGSLAALAGATVYPYFIHQAAGIQSETLFGCLLAWGTLFLVRGLDDEGRLGWVALGSLCYSLGNMVRPNLSVFLPLLAGWLLIRWRRQPRRLLIVGVTLAAPLLLISLPWSLAVWREGLGLIWVSDGMGLFYWIGHNDGIAALYCSSLSPAEAQTLRLSLAQVDPLRDIAASLPPAHQQGVYWQAALAWDRAHLALQPCLAWHKLVGYWRLWVNPAVYGRSLVMLSLASLPVLLLGGLGLVQSRRGRGRTLARLALLHALAGTLVAVVFSTEIRYRVPLVDVLFFALAGVAVEKLRCWRAVARPGHPQ